MTPTGEHRLHNTAQAIYTAVYGDIDNTSHADEKMTEIYNWLVNGHLQGTETVAALADAWCDYEHLADDDEEGATQ
jgi:hypothetical protein